VAKNEKGYGNPQSTGTALDSNSNWTV